MCLGEVHPDPVPFGSAPGALLYRKPGRPKPFKQSPSGGVDVRRVLQRGLGPGEDLLQEIRLLREKLLDRTVPLLLVAGTAGQRQVRHPVRPAFAFGVDMVDLQGNLLRLAVSAGPSSLLQEVLPDLVACQCALLICDAGNFRVFHFLEIECHEFLADS